MARSIHEMAHSMGQMESSIARIESSICEIERAIRPAEPSIWVIASALCPVADSVWKIEDQDGRWPGDFRKFEAAIFRCVVVQRFANLTIPKIVENYQSQGIQGRDINGVIFPARCREGLNKPKTNRQVMANYDTPGVMYDSGVRYDEVVTAPANTRKPMAKIKLGLFRLNVEQKLTLGGNIKTAMTGNANFPSPNPALPAYGILTATLATKHAAVVALQSQIKTALAERDEAELAFDAGTTQLASYVDNIALGRAAIIESAGMGVKAMSAPLGVLPQVQNLALSSGDKPGEVDGQWNAVHGRSIYEVDLCTDDPTVEANWKRVKSASPSKTTLTGLTSGTRVWVRVRAKAPKDVNDGPWSDPATIIVP